jgi:5-methyltetrahydrofolate--homocysteine methyltransferase
MAENVKKDNKIELLLREKPWLLADGATGTQLFEMGLLSGDSPEIWNESKPNLIKSLYQSSIDAGCDLFLTNSFGSNASRLKLHGAEKRAFSLSQTSAELGQEVSAKANKTVIVAGSIGPTGEILSPIGDLSEALAIEIFHEQAEGLKAGGADVLWIETISAKEEFISAVKAAELADMPWCGTMSFDSSGRTMMGFTSKQMTALIQTLNKNLIAYGANCGVGAADLLRTVLGFEQTKYPLIAKGNAGIPKYKDGHIHYDGTPELMADYACLARDSGAKIIGGCCGTTPIHLKEMKYALESRPPKPPPTHIQITQCLGAFSSQNDGTEKITQPGRISRRKKIKIKNLNQNL